MQQKWGHADKLVMISKSAIYATEMGACRQAYNDFFVSYIDS